MQIQHHATTLFRNHPHRLVQRLAAPAIGGKHIARRAPRVNPHQHSVLAWRSQLNLARQIPSRRQAAHSGSRVEGRTVLAQIAAHQRNVALAAVHFTLVSDHAELAVLRLNAALARAHNIPLVAQPVANQLRHGKNQQPVFLAEWNQVRNARHLAVIAHNLANHARRVQPRQPRQVYRCLGLARPHQHPAPARPQRKHMPRPRQVARIGARIDGRTNRMRPVRRRDSRRHSLARLNRLGERCAKPRRVLLRHRKKPQMIRALLGKRQANQSPPVPRHKVDGLRRNVLRRQRKIALILAILVVHHHHHPPRAYLLDRAGNVGKRSFEAAW